jgi:hypothetical protein
LARFGLAWQDLRRQRKAKRQCADQVQCLSAFRRQSLASARCQRGS